MRDEARDTLASLLGAPIAHRGLHACGQPGGPMENSVGAARAAADRGFGIECDVQLSRDGEAMVFHDADLDRLTAARGPLARRDAADIERLSLGDTTERMPTLAAFLAAIGARAPVVVEIKGDGGLALARRVLAVLDIHDGPVAVESFDTAIVSLCLADPERRHPVGLVGPPDRGNPDHDLAARCDFLSWSVAHLGAIAACHPGVPLSTWTVRDPAQVEVARRCVAQIVFEGFVPDRRR